MDKLLLPLLTMMKVALTGAIGFLVFTFLFSFVPSIGVPTHVLSAWYNVVSSAMDLNVILPVQEIFTLFLYYLTMEMVILQVRLGVIVWRVLKGSSTKSQELTTT